MCLWNQSYDFMCPYSSIHLFKIWKKNWDECFFLLLLSNYAFGTIFGFLCKYCGKAMQNLFSFVSFLLYELIIINWPVYRFFIFKCRLGDVNLFFFPPEGLSFRLVSYDNILSAFNNSLSVVPKSEKGVECICMAYW